MRVHEGPAGGVRGKRLGFSQNASKAAAANDVVVEMRTTPVGINLEETNHR
jgi:hypothetical protein